MKNKSLLFLLVTCFVSCKTVYPISEEMKTNLQIMRDKDQDYAAPQKSDNNLIENKIGKNNLN